MSEQQPFMLRNVDIVRCLNPKNISGLIFDSQQVTFVSKVDPDRSAKTSFGQPFVVEMDENDKLLFGVLLVAGTSESEFISIGYDPVDHMTVFGSYDFNGFRLFFKPQGNSQCKVFIPSEDHMIDDHFTPGFHQSYPWIYQDDDGHFPNYGSICDMSFQELIDRISGKENN